MRKMECELCGNLPGELPEGCTFVDCDFCNKRVCTASCAEIVSSSDSDKDVWQCSECYEAEPVEGRSGYVNEVY